MKFRYPILACFFAVAACGGDDMAKGADAAAPSCADEPSVASYSPGMVIAADDGSKIVLVTASPAPPERFMNTWSIQARDAQDQPLDLVSLSVKSFMPKHGHGASLTSVTAAGSEAGRYEIGPFDLWMSGIWEVTFEAETSSGTATAVLTLCIEE